MTAQNPIPILESHLLKDVTHGFFTRQGGVSIGNYGTLNFSLKEGSLENVEENKRRALKALSLETLPLCLLKQVHGKTVHFVDQDWDFNTRLEGDALITNRYDVVLGVQTADCAPILLADPIEGFVGAIHGGWRGVAAGVIEETIQALLDRGANPRTLVASVGPCIARESYEVGEDLYEAMLDKDMMYEVFFGYKYPPGTRHFDLPGIVAKIIRGFGISVECLPYDTYASEDLFFSCRRAFHEKAMGFGGQLSAISLMPRKRS